MKFKLEGWDDKATTKEVTVSIDDAGEEESTVYFEEVKFGVGLAELEQLIRFAKQL